MTKILFLGNQSFLSELFEVSLNSTRHCLPEGMSFEVSQINPIKSASSKSLIKAFRPRFDLRNRKTRASLKDRVVSSEFDHVHCLSPDVADRELFAELGVSYSVSCATDPLQGGTEQDLVDRVAVLRSAEFVACNGQWMKSNLLEETGLDVKRVMNLAWPVPVDVSANSVERDGVILVTEQFNSDLNQDAINSVIEKLCHGEDCTIVSTADCPIAEPIGFSWYKLNAKSKVLGEMLSHSRLCIVPETSANTFPVLINSLAAGLPVVVANSESVREVVLDGGTGYVVDGQEQNFEAKAIQILDNYVKHKRMSQNSESHFARTFDLDSIIGQLFKVLDVDRTAAGRRSRTTVNLIDGISIGRQRVSDAS